MRDPKSVMRRVIIMLLAETSTLRGIVVAVIAIGGWQMAPERLDAVAFIAVTVGALMKALLPDRWFKQSVEE